MYNLKKILILGGTAEARLLTEKLASETNLEIILSLSGTLGAGGETAFRDRLEVPFRDVLNVRVGGFGGSEGLASYITQNNIDCVIDATHPFASGMSWNAHKACNHTGKLLKRLIRPEWQPNNNVNWTETASLESAARLLDPGANVFLAVGKNSLSAFSHRTDCRFISRSIAPIDPSSFQAPLTCIQAHPGQNLEQEAASLKGWKVTHIVSKNSGGSKPYFKILAANKLELKIIMIKRPELPHCEEYNQVSEILDIFKQSYI